MAGKRKDNKGRVLRTGESQRKQDGRYVYDYTDPTGARKRVYGLTLAELREKEKQIQMDLSDGIDTSKSNMTLNSLFKMYLESKSDLRDSTRCNYEALWKNAVKESVIGNMKISQIKQIHVKAFYTSLANQGYAAATIKLYHSLIYPALEMAVDSDLIRKNPAKGARKGTGGTKKEKKSLTRAEQNNLTGFLREDNIYSVYAPMINLALSTGLRIGELAGLRWADVDMKENVIHVRQQLIYKNLGNGCKFHIQELKTEAGRRDIPMTETAKESLAKQREYYLTTGRAFKRQEVDGVNDFVFTNTKGRPYATNAFNFVLDNIVRTYNKKASAAAEANGREPDLLPHISAHVLRHTACTRLAESGLEPKVLQVVMGHSSIAITMDVYTHLDFEQIQKKMDALQSRTG